MEIEPTNKGGRPPKITAEVRQEIENLFTAGKSPKDIAAELELALSSVYIVRSEMRRREGAA